MAEGRATIVETLRITWELTLWGAFILGKLIVPHLIKKFPILFWGIESLLLRSQDRYARLCPEPDQSIPRLTTLFIGDTL